MVTVMTGRIIRNVTMMVEIVVDYASTLSTALNVNVLKMKVYLIILVLLVSLWAMVTVMMELIRRNVAMTVEIVAESALKPHIALNVNVSKMKGHIILLVLHILGLEMGSVMIQ